MHRSSIRRAFTSWSDSAYIGWLTIFWAAPDTRQSPTLVAVATTAYILLAIRFEERDLISAFGER